MRDSSKLISRRSAVMVIAGGVANLGFRRWQQFLPSIPARVASAPETTILISNARVFDGVDGRLKPGHVLITGSRITAVSPSAIIPATGIESGHVDRLSGAIRECERVVPFRDVDDP